MSRGHECKFERVWFNQQDRELKVLKVEYNLLTEKLRQISLQKNSKMRNIESTVKEITLLLEAYIPIIQKAWVVPDTSLWRVSYALS